MAAKALSARPVGLGQMSIEVDQIAAADRAHRRRCRARLRARFTQLEPLRACTALHAGTAGDPSA
jgi:hypothetical protein